MTSAYGGVVITCLCISCCFRIPEMEMLYCTTYSRIPLECTWPDNLAYSYPFSLLDDLEHAIMRRDVNVLYNE